MKLPLTLLFALLLTAPWAPVSAQVVFSQDFSSSANVGDYAGSGPNQFDAINSGPNFTWTINNGTLEGTRSGATSGSINRITDLPTSNSAASFEFDLNVTAITSVSTSSNDVVFQVGAGYTTATGAESTLTFAQFTLNLANTNGQYIVNGPGITLTGAHHFFFVVNRSGGTINYTAPGGSSQSLLNGNVALYVDTTQAFANQAAAATGGNAANDITDFKLRFATDQGTIQVDNLKVTVVPEPATWILLVSGLGLLGWRAGRRQALNA